MITSNLASILACQVLFRINVYCKTGLHQANTETLTPKFILSTRCSFLEENMIPQFYHAMGVLKWAHLNLIDMDKERQPQKLYLRCQFQIKR